MLLQSVQSRKQFVSKTNHKEKFQCVMSPYELIEGILTMANYFLRLNSTHPGWSQSSLRNRFTLLFTKAGILRGNYIILI